MFEKISNGGFVVLFLLNRRGASEHNVVVAALYNTCGAYYGELGLLLKLGNSDSAAVTHSGLNLIERALNIVVKRSCVGYI